MKSLLTCGLMALLVPAISLVTPAEARAGHWGFSLSFGSPRYYGGYGGYGPSYGYGGYGSYYGNGGHDFVPHWHGSTSPYGTYYWYGNGPHDYVPHEHSYSPYSYRGYHYHPWGSTESIYPRYPYYYSPW